MVKIKKIQIKVLGANFLEIFKNLPFILLVLFFGMEMKSFAQSTPSKVLLALSKSEHVLAIIDPISFKILAKIPVGIDPHEVVSSSDGKTAYVTIYGGGSLHELNIIDLVAQKPLPSLDTKPFLGPHGIAFSAGKVWFTAEGSKSIASYDPTLGKIDWSMGTGQDRTHMIYVDASGKKNILLMLALLR